jgi:hypothetical protein
MATTFKEVRKLQGERVRMQFVDGREVVALLLCATKDIDGSKHLIYDKVESVSGAETCGTVATAAFMRTRRTWSASRRQTQRKSLDPFAVGTALACVKKSKRHRRRLGVPAPNLAYCQLPLPTSRTLPSA